MPVRLLHLSDIHFGAENKAALEAVTDFIHATPFDLLVLSGDITQSGCEAEFSAAGAWLSGLPGPRLSTPGNHDTPWMGLVARLVKPFESYASSIGPAASASFQAPGLHVHAMNSARGWQLRLNWSKGEVSRRQADAAADALAASSGDALRVVVCHHPLVEAVREPMTARVRGGKSAARRLCRADVDIVLSGHIHAPFVEPLPFGDGHSYAVGAGTLSLRERGVPPGFNVINIAGDEMAVSGMVWEAGRLDVRDNWVVPLRPRVTHGAGQRDGVAP